MYSVAPSGLSAGAQLRPTCELKPPLAADTETKRPVPFASTAAMALSIASGFADTARTPKYTVPFASLVSGVHTRRLALNAAGLPA